MSRSPIPRLCLLALAADPTRDRPYTTTEVRDAVARIGGPVTRDTIARHLHNLADTVRNTLPAVEWRGPAGNSEHRWQLTSEGWHAHNQRPLDRFAYCEPNTATGLDTWHIRRLTDAGRRLGGGIDTPTLCGRDWQGWDLEAPVTVANAFDGSRHINDAGRPDVCRRCAEALPHAVSEETR